MTEALHPVYVNGETRRFRRWKVTLERKWLTTVYCDPTMAEDEVYRGLVFHDGLHPAIRVKAED